MTRFIHLYFLLHVRILVLHLDDFKSQTRTVPVHIASTYSKEKGLKSKTVSVMYLYLA